jgi:lipopolysaccharide transport system ATP-binding protein
MAEKIAIQADNLGKMFKLYRSTLDTGLDALGLRWLLPWHKIQAREFWALRKINLTVPPGKRLGIIGRNGAGKSTLLKIISGNLAPTEGSIEISGNVQALMQAGAGFHPEFTGYENIHASLTYQGFTPNEIKDAVEDITEFTELGEFLDQPFKTFSAGMKARLTFATATVLRPGILIIDEVLGAGDGYFLAKSTERMEKLVKESGATVLLVSHAMNQITRFCEEVIWLERGHIVERGPAMEVVKAYDEHLLRMTERRLRAKNALIQSGVEEGAAQYKRYNDTLFLRFTCTKDTHCDIAEIALLEDDKAFEQIRVGDVQDFSPNQPASLQLDRKSAWSGPQEDQTRPYRRLMPGTGTAIFQMEKFFEDSSYKLRVDYRGAAELRIVRNDDSFAVHDLSPSETWMTHTITLSEGSASPVLPQPQEKGGRAVRRWPGEGSLLIEDVKLFGAGDRERMVFRSGEPFSIAMRIQAQKAGVFPVWPVAAFYRLDGIPVCRLWPESPTKLQLENKDLRTVRLDFGSLNLGDGYYVVSVAAYRDKIALESCYDLIDRAYEFQVINTDERLKDAIFLHPFEWSIF